jgi:phthiodiolone/phenolphthiodiolone dimycocerosates ketoreductase
VQIELGLPGGIMPPFSRVIDQARRAEAKGYDSLWWPCHLMGWHPQSVWRTDVTPLAAMQKNADVYFDPVPTIAAVGAQTSRIRLGIGVTDVIRRHPAMLAQSILTLDHITKGRAILGLGAGEALNITPYGLDFSKAVSKLEEGLRLIRLLWSAEGPVNFDGKFWQLRDAVLGLSPFEDRCPPIWLAAHGPRMLKITGQLADGWLPTRMTPAEYAEKLAAIRKGSQEAGRPVDAVKPGMLAYVVVDPDREVVRRLLDHLLVKGLCLLLPAELFERYGAEPPLGRKTSGFEDYIPTRVGYEKAVATMSGVPHEVVEYYTLHGTPEDVAEQIQALAAAGLRQVVLWNITAFADPSRARSSFECLDRVRTLLAETA